MIVETEGYLEHDDAASHARFGPTGRSRVMYGPPGMAYVYFIYGMHFMFNVVTEPEGKAGAVLVRALEPLEGLDVMASRRGLPDKGSLTSGPARLCQALAITLDLNEADLTRGPLCILHGKPVTGAAVQTTPRIGVGGSREEPYRFVLKGNPYVSKQFSGGGDSR
jgi:DNA-3-methyladenine glycosylase